MDKQKTVDQQTLAVELKALKIGLVIFVTLLFFMPFFVAIPISLAVAAGLSLFMTLKAGLPISRKKRRWREDTLEAQHKTNLINMPVTSSLSVFHNAGAGFQHYHHHSQFHR